MLFIFVFKILQAKHGQLGKILKIFRRGVEMLTVKKSLIASVLCAVTSVGFVMNVSAQEADNKK